jgi:hypothetical protein
VSETMRMWTEVSFNVAYLVVVWGLVIVMYRRRAEVLPADWPLARLFIGAFALLALGDTGHVGFRVMAYALGGLESTITVFGAEIGLVGIGALATATTVTLFYVAVLFIWKTRFGRPLGWFGYVLLAAAGIRLIVMIPAANEWNNVVPPQPWSFYRNLPLIIQGLGVAFLILRDARALHDRTFTWIGVMILASYAFYTPVILFVQEVPFVGMLMIPKTLAYVAIAIIGYRSLYLRQGSAYETQPLTGASSR